MRDLAWLYAVAVADPAPLRSFQIFSGGLEQELTEAQAKAACVADYRRRLKNPLAGFEWHETEIGYKGGSLQLVYEVWRMPA